MTEVAFIGDDEIVTVRAGELTVTTRTGVPVGRIAETVERDAVHRRPRRLQLVHAQGDRRATRRAAADRGGPRRAETRCSEPVTPTQLAQISRITITGLRHLAQRGHGRQAAAPALGRDPDHHGDRVGVVRLGAAARSAVSW